MQIPQLVSFYHVARLRSITKAAHMLQLGQPTVTTHLKKLEEEFGVVLFDRIHRPIQLTSEGSAILDMVAPVVNGLAALKTHVENVGQHGSLSVAAYSELVLHQLPELVRTFRSTYPDVPIRLLSRPHASMLQMVKSGEVDLAFSASPLTPDPSLDFVELFRTSTMLVTPPGHELLYKDNIEISDIGRCPLVLYYPGTIIRTRLERALEDQGISYEIAVELENAEVVKRYVRIGMGVTILGDIVLEPEDYQSLGVVKIDHLLSNLTFGIYTQRGRFMGRPALNFIDSLKAAYSSQRT